MLLRRCMLAVLNSGNDSDDALALFENYRDFDVGFLQEDRGLKVSLKKAPGIAFVDGGLVGGPPAPGRPATRLYVSGADAERVCALAHTSDAGALFAIMEPSTVYMAPGEEFKVQLAIRSQLRSPSFSMGPPRLLSTSSEPAR